MILKQKVILRPIDSLIFAEVFGTSY